MYSKELEEIIDAALADGVITDKERAVLHKRAIAEGVDPDELDVVIEGKLAKMQKVEKDWMRPVPPPFVQTQEEPQSQSQNSKFGVVNKCPNCGTVVEAGTVRCSDCGYTFRGINGNSSVEKLSRQIQEAEDKYPANGFAEMFGMSKRLSVVPSIISNFPVPNTKDDLLEFIIFLEPKTKIRRSADGPYDQKKCQAFKKKYDECVKKAKLFFPDDPQFKMIIPQKKGLFGLFK